MVIAASLLVKDIVASPLVKRATYVEVDEVVVTAEVIVTYLGDGVYATGAASNIATVTIDGTPVLVTNTVAASSTAPAPVPTSTSEAAVFVQTSSISKPSLTIIAVPPTTSSTSIYVAPTMPAPQAQIVPTTLAKVASSSTTTSAKAAPTVASSSTSSSKRGVAYNVESLTNAFASASLVSWAYNWGSTTSTISSTLQYVPMLWGLSSDHTSGWTSAVTKALATGSTHILGFNEPDYSLQANLDTASAAAGWKTYLEPYAGKAKLGSPAVTNGAAPMGLQWLEGFITACADCTIDFVCIHWYNGGSAADFKAYVAQAYAAGKNRPLWITEFQAPGSDAEQQAFLEIVLPWLDSTPMVERYAYFMARDGILISGTSLSALGSTYAMTA